MSSEYLARLFQQGSLARIIRFDEQIVSLAGLGDLQPALWERFLTPRSRLTSEMTSWPSSTWYARTMRGR